MELSAEPSIIAFLATFVFLAGVAVLVAMIAYSKTRVLGIVLLCGGGGLLILLGAVIYFIRADFVATRQFGPHDQPATIESPPRMVAKPAPTPVNPKKAETDLLEAAERATSVVPASEAPKKVEAEAPVAAKPSKPANSRPAWVDATPQLVGDAYQMSITVGPYTSRQECDVKLPEALQEAVDSYVETCLGGQPEERVVLPGASLEQLVKEKWEEVRQHTFGPTTQLPMTNLHVLLQFDRKVKEQILEEHKNCVIARRLWTTGIVLAVGLAMLAAVYGFLKMPRGRNAE